MVEDVSCDSACWQAPRVSPWPKMSVPLMIPDYGTSGCGAFCSARSPRAIQTSYHSIAVNAACFILLYCQP